MYTVTFGDQAREFDTRQEAIAAAKEISADRHGAVEIEEQSGHERLTYRNGDLESYVYDLRGRPSR